MTMTDYLEPELVQEEMEEYVSHEMIMEQFAAMQCMFVQADLICEYQSIKEFCGSDITVPEMIQEGSFGDFMDSVISNIVDFFMGIIRSIVNSFNRNTLSKFIGAVQKKDDKDFKISDNFKADIAAMEEYFSSLDYFADLLNKLEDGLLDNPETDKEKNEAKKTEKDITNNGEKTISELISDYQKSAKELVKASNENPNNDAVIVVKTREELLEALKKIYDLNLPVTGRKLLKRLELTKSKIKKNGKVDKDVVRGLRQIANHYATMYDKLFRDLILDLDKVASDNNINIKGLNADNIKPYTTDSKSKWKDKNFRGSKPVGKATETFNKLETKEKK